MRRSAFWASCGAKGTEPGVRPGGCSSRPPREARLAWPALHRQLASPLPHTAPAPAFHSCSKLLLPPSHPISRVATLPRPGFQPQSHGASSHVRPFPIPYGAVYLHPLARDLPRRQSSSSLTLRAPLQALHPLVPTPSTPPSRWLGRDGYGYAAATVPLFQSAYREPLTDAPSLSSAPPASWNLPRPG